MNENAPQQQRQYIGRRANPDELRALNILIMKKEVATQNAQNSQFPPGTSPQTQSAFYKAAMELFSEAKFEEDQWWKNALLQYNLQGIKVYIDQENGEFFTLVDAVQPAPPPPAPPVEPKPVVVE